MRGRKRAGRAIPAGWRGLNERVEPIATDAAACTHASSTFPTTHASGRLTLLSKATLFAGSEGGGKAMTIAFKLIERTKFNEVDPQAWLTCVLSQIADHKITRLDERLPWHYAA